MSDAVPPAPKSNKVLIIALVAGAGCLGLVVIIGIVAALVLPATAKALSKAKTEATRAELRQLQAAIRMYEADHGELPPSGNRSLVDVLERGRNGGSYLDVSGYRRVGGEIVDLWGQPIVYRRGTGPTPRPVLLSAGPDGRDDNGGGDDISPD